MCTHCAPQVMQGEMRDAVLNSGNGGIQRINADVQRALARVAAAFRKDVLATPAKLAQRL